MRISNTTELGTLFLKIGLIIVVCLFCMTRQGYSQENPPTNSGHPHDTKPLSDEDLLKAIQNPVADLISVPIQNITNFRIGQHNRTDNAVSFQPVIPVKLSEDWLLVTRTILPIAWQPYPDHESGGQFGLGDMNPTFFLAPKTPSSVIWGVGPALVIPTATGNILGSGKLSLGPSAVVLAQPGKWTFGALVSNVWSIAGLNSRPTVNKMSLQYFICYNLKDDWYLNSSPILAADWRAKGGDQWLVPFGGGVGKLVTIGSMPVDFSASVYGNVVKPTGAPSWQLNLQVSLLFPK
jgi:hypothetical protein